MFLWILHDFADLPEICGPTTVWNIEAPIKRMATCKANNSKSPLGKQRDFHSATCFSPYL